MTVGCQAQQQQHQITSLQDELGVTEESRTAGQFDEIKEEDEEDCREESAEEEEGGNEAGLGQSEVAQAGSPITTSTSRNMGSFQTDQMSEMEEDNFVDTLMEEGNLGDDLEDDFNIGNLDGVNGEGDNLDGSNGEGDDLDGVNGGEGENGEGANWEGANGEGDNGEGANREGDNGEGDNSSLAIMAPFNKVFNITNVKYEETTENIEDNFGSGKIKLDDEMKLKNTSDQEQSTKSVLELFGDGLDEISSSEIFNASDIHQAKSRSDHNDGSSFARIQKSHMLFRFISVTMLIYDIIL